MDMTNLGSFPVAGVAARETGEFFKTTPQNHAAYYNRREESNADELLCQY